MYVQLVIKMRCSYWLTMTMTMKVFSCSGGMCASMVMRLIESGDLAACPWEDLAPLMAWMAERMRE